MAVKMTRKEEYKLKHLLKIIKTEPIKMFCDFQNECDYLYDDITIDENTINFINEYFKFYDIDVKYFYDEFRNTLRLILPRYYQMLKLEIDNDVTKIYNNIRFKRFCSAITDDTIQNKINKNNKDITYNENYTGNNNVNENGTNTNTINGNTSSSGNSNTNIDSDERSANKQNPLSNEADDFDELFNWETSTEINENVNEENTRTTTSNNETRTQTDNGSNTLTRETTDEVNRNYTQNDINKAHEDLRKIAKGLKDDEEITTEINNLIVENINKIVDYLFKNNRASDYLINNLKKCFVSVYYYN